MCVSLRYRTNGFLQREFSPGESGAGRRIGLPGSLGHLNCASTAAPFHQHSSPPGRHHTSEPYGGNDPLRNPSQKQGRSRTAAHRRGVPPRGKRTPCKTCTAYRSCSSLPCWFPGAPRGPADGVRVTSALGTCMSRADARTGCEQRVVAPRSAAACPGPQSRMRTPPRSAELRGQDSAAVRATRDASGCGGHVQLARCQPAALEFLMTYAPGPLGLVPAVPGIQNRLGQRDRICGPDH